jgi:hypothetical protein
MEIFFVGRHALTSSLPISEVDEEVGKFKGVDLPGFQVVDTFDCLKELQTLRQKACDLSCGMNGGRALCATPLHDLA